MAWYPAGPDGIHRLHSIQVMRFEDGLLAELTTSTYLVGSTPTVADLALCAYVARAPEGDISLEPYPAVRAWLARIEALPGFVPMPFAPKR